MMRSAIALLLMLCVPLAARAGDELDALAGRALFKRNWVPAPASTKSAQGLGPLFNARSCAQCHDGGGPARFERNDDGQTNVHGAVVRLGNARGEIDRFYGQQLQTFAVPGLDSEATIGFEPKLDIKLHGPSLSPGTNAGVRLAPSLAGRARFDDISDEAILQEAERQRTTGNGIAGRARRIGPDGSSGAIGKFGWKAAHATLEEQIANAFALDLGLSSPRDSRAYGDCTALQTACLAAPNGRSAQSDGEEVSAQMLALLALYLRDLTASGRAPQPDPQTGPQTEPQSTQDLALFHKTGCAQCHVPSLAGRDGRPIATFSDMLLHDLGPGLDDGVGEPGVASQEWRTAPLLDLGARRGTRRYLHDGRARTLPQAIAAHGGEAKDAAHNFAKLETKDQRRIIQFLQHQ